MSELASEPVSQRPREAPGRGRAGVRGLASPHPIGHGLPAMYLGDPFTQQLCAALDEVLAPVLATLDSFPAYLDPATTPADYLGPLAGWLGVEIDGHLPEDRRRDMVVHAVTRTARRGTRAGLVDAILDAFGPVVTPADIEILDPGGAHWSLQPGAPLPGAPDGVLLIRVRVADPAAVDLRRLETLIAAAVPAHLPHRVELVPRNPPG